MSKGAKIEADLWVLFFVLLGVTLFLAKDKISIPDSWYPANWWNKFASSIDGFFYGLPDAIKSVTDPVQKPIDRGLASVFQWFNDTFPDASQRQIKQQFRDQGGMWPAAENVDNYVPPGTGEVDSDVQAGGGM